MSPTDSVIFLDIDGVLNNDITANMIQKQKKSWWIVDPQNVKVLNQLLERVSANVVITSMWRQNMSMEKLRSILVESGFKYPERIIDTTPLKLTNKDLINRATNGIGLRPNTAVARCWEIIEWLDENRPKHYVIVDDMDVSDNDKNARSYMENLNKKFIEVDSTAGLSEEHLAIIEQKLNI